jgi:hypothetical protein
MKLQANTGSFDFHVDAKHFGFQWSEAMYIKVEYSALKRDGDVVASVYNISAAPWLIGSITIRGNWMIVDKEITSAAQDHAAKTFDRNDHVNETILSAIAPHINR